jgi:hypothetical protein
MAIEDLVVAAVGDAALVSATLVLAYVTRALYKETSVLAQIEKKRDQIQVLSERVKLAEGLIVLEPILISTYLGGPGMRATSGVAEAAASVRRLRIILPKPNDKALSDLVFSLDYLIMNLNNADSGAIDPSGVEKEISKQVEFIKGQLRNNLLPKWRAELQALYGD